MSDIEFKTLEELYNRIKPALYSKVEELKRKGISYVKEEDIWNYLSINVWKHTDNLSLAFMVSTIIDLKEDDIKSYVLDLLKKQERNIVEEGTLLWKTKNYVVA